LKKSRGLKTVTPSSPFLADETIPAIAERLGISNNAASVRRRRAIERAASLMKNGRL